MRIELEQWLTSVIGPDRTELYKDSVELLNDLSENSQEQIFTVQEEILTKLDSMDNDSLVDLLLINIVDLSVATLIEYGFTVDESNISFHDIPTLNRLMILLRYGTDWENHDVIIDAIESSDTYQETLILLYKEILPNIDISDMLTIIVNIDSRYFENLVAEHKIAKYRIQLLEPETPIPKYYKTVRLFINKYNTKVSTSFIGFLLAGGTIGLSFSEYFNMFINKILDDVILPNQAFEWIAMALASGYTHPDNIKKIIFDHLDDVYDDMYKGQTVSTKISKIVNTEILFKEEGNINETP